MDLQNLSFKSLVAGWQLSLSRPDQMLVVFIFNYSGAPLDTAMSLFFISEITFIILISKYPNIRVSIQKAADIEFVPDLK